MSVSFRTAFAAFVSKETMDACAKEDACIALLEGIYREGHMRFLMGNASGMLVWQPVEDAAEIVAIHTLPESRGTGLGHMLLEEALQQIGDRPCFSGRLRTTFLPAGFMKSTVFNGTARSASVNSMALWKCAM